MPDTQANWIAGAVGALASGGAGSPLKTIELTPRRKVSRARRSLIGTPQEDARTGTVSSESQEQGVNRKSSADAAAAEGLSPGEARSTPALSGTLSSEAIAIMQPEREAPRLSPGNGHQQSAAPITPALAGAPLKRKGGRPRIYVPGTRVRIDSLPEPERAQYQNPGEAIRAPSTLRSVPHRATNPGAAIVAASPFRVSPHPNPHSPAAMNEAATAKVSRQGNLNPGAAEVIVPANEQPPHPETDSPAAEGLSPTRSSARRGKTAQGEAKAQVHPAASLSHPELAVIVEQHRRRWDFIRARQRLELQAMAVCRRLSDGDKEAGAKLWQVVLKDEGHALRSWLHPFIMAAQPLRDAQDEVEATLVKLVRKLPVYAWAKEIKGLGDVSLAAILGECAYPIGTFKSVAAVWKRMGLAVIGEERQRRIAGAAALDHGYNAQRRSIMWNIGQGLIRAQVRSKIDEETGEKVSYSIGDYGALYLERKVYEQGKVETKGHAHNRAQRYIEKRLLRELFREWRRHDQPGADNKLSADIPTHPAELEPA